MKMGKSVIDFFEEYKMLRREIEKQSNHLSKMHSKHMKCRKGCDMCCIDYRIFPIEFHFIVNKIKKKGANINVNSKIKKGNCMFLSNHICTIYNDRPVICRTHGLPLLFMNENSEWELSACELNFTAFDFSEFNFDNTFPQDKFNSRLFMLNKEFISEYRENKYNETDLLPLKELMNYI